MAKRAIQQGGPKVGYFIQSRGPGGVVEFEEVYVYGPTRRSDEGIVGHDLQMRPTRLGPGDYTFVASPDDVEWTRPVSAPTKRSSAQIKREVDESQHSTRKAGVGPTRHPSTKKSRAELDHEINEVLNFSSDDLKGVVAYRGKPVASRSPRGWTPIKSESTNVDRAVHSAIFSMPNEVSASELRREITARL